MSRQDTFQQRIKVSFYSRFGKGTHRITAKGEKTISTNGNQNKKSFSAIRGKNSHHA